MEPVKSYPSADIDPKLKDKDWILKNAQAFWYDCSNNVPRTMFNGARAWYDKLRLYALGKQSNAPYKPLAGVDEKDGKTFMNISWAIIGFISSKRGIILSKMNQQQYGVVATPIDTQGRDANNNYFAELKAKLLMQKQVAQVDPALANHPALALNPKDPRDLEELEMRLEFGEQFNRAMDAELACELVFYRNNIDSLFKQVDEDLFDYGVAGVIDDLDCNNMPTLSRADPRHIITNMCHKWDFSDLTSWGKITEVSKSDLQKYFTPDQLDAVNNNDYRGAFDATTLNGHQDLKDKLKVLHFEFYSTDGIVWENGIDKFGNARMPRAEYSKNGDKYIKKSVKNVYTGKWVIGTDMIYEYGLKTNMKRSADAKKQSDTTLSLHLVSYLFHEMYSQSFMEMVLPLIDNWQLTYYKLQNLKANMVPNGFAINIDALQSVALGKGGENMSPGELLDMFAQKGIILYSGENLGLGESMGNHKPIETVQNQIASELLALYQDMANTKMQIDEVWALNTITNGGTPDPKMLNGVADMMAQSTNNGLWQLFNAKKALTEKIAEESVKRVQQSIRRNGEYSGFMPALNSNVMQFIKADEGLALRDYGIKMEVKLTNEQKQWLVTLMQQDVQNGFLDSADVFTVLNTSSLKQAQMTITYRVKKNKENKQKEALQLQQMNGQIQQQSNQQAAQNKAMEIQMETQSKASLIQLEKDLELRNKTNELQLQAKIADSTNQARVTGHLITANTKKDVERMKKGEDSGDMEMPPPQQSMPPMPPTPQPMQDEPEMVNNPQEEMAEMA